MSKELGTCDCTNVPHPKCIENWRPLPPDQGPDVPIMTLQECADAETAQPSPTLDPAVKDSKKLIAECQKLSGAPDQGPARCKDCGGILDENSKPVYDGYCKHCEPSPLMEYICDVGGEHVMLKPHKPNDVYCMAHHSQMSLAQPSPTLEPQTKGGNLDKDLMGNPIDLCGPSAEGAATERAANAIPPQLSAPDPLEKLADSRVTIWDFGIAAGTFRYQVRFGREILYGCESEEVAETKRKAVTAEVLSALREARDEGQAMKRACIHVQSEQISRLRAKLEAAQQAIRDVDAAFSDLKAAVRQNAHTTPTQVINALNPVKLLLEKSKAALSAGPAKEGQ